MKNYINVYAFNFTVKEIYKTRGWFKRTERRSLYVKIENIELF
jgi:hypothetical protein